jgi:hypothetical protein
MYKPTSHGQGGHLLLQLCHDEMASSPIAKGKAPSHVSRGWSRPSPFSSHIFCCLSSLRDNPQINPNQRRQSLRTPLMPIPLSGENCTRNNRLHKLFVFP